MPPVKTRECTEVYTTAPAKDSLPRFESREVERIDLFTQLAFRSDNQRDSQQVLHSLQEMYEWEVARKARDKKPNKHTFEIPKTSWKEKINKKRDFIRRVISNKATFNIKEIAKFTKCSWQTVKKARNDMLTFGRVTPFEYNFLKTPEELVQVRATIDHCIDSGKSVADVKRIHPTFSRKKILDEMHKAGLRYRAMPKQRKNPLVKPQNSANIVRVISHLTQGLESPATEVLYCDEMKFPLYQTSTHAWTNLPDHQRPVYNLRDDQRQLTAIALCSTRGFVAVQIYRQEVSAVDFLYFLNKAVKGLPVAKSYSILADNAAWHHAQVVEKAEVRKFLFFNELRMFQLNIIENAFSFVRNAFRKRAVVESQEEEAMEILRIFFDERNEQRFRGLFRNHLRQLTKFCEIHSS